MKFREYKRWIQKHGYCLKKSGSGDYSLLDLAGKMVIPFIKVTHPGNEIPGYFVNQTRKILEDNVDD